MTDEKNKVNGGHEVSGTRIWCDRAPYDVMEDKAEVERHIEHFLRNAREGIVGPQLAHFRMSKNLLPCALVVDKISAIEPHVVR
jgi:hypothetical protein